MGVRHRRIRSALLLGLFALASLAPAAAGGASASGGSDLVPTSFAPRPAAALTAFSTGVQARVPSLDGPFGPRGAPGSDGAPGSAPGPDTHRARPGAVGPGPELRPGETVLAGPPDAPARDALSRLRPARIGRLSSPSTAPPVSERLFTLD